MFKKFIFSSVPARFQSEFSPEESARRLKANVRRTLLFTLKPSAVGRVTPDKVVLRWSRPFFNNSFIPIFKGKFQIENGRTFLVGSFSMHLFVKIFMTSWFGVLIYGIISSLIESVVYGFDAAHLNMPGFELILAAFGGALVWSGKWFARNDIKLISETVQSSIHPNARTHSISEE